MYDQGDLVSRRALHLEFIHYIDSMFHPNLFDKEIPSLLVVRNICVAHLHPVLQHFVDLRTCISQFQFLTDFTGAKVNFIFYNF